MSPSDCIVAYILLLVLWLAIWGRTTRWKINTTLAIVAFLCICSVIALVYYYAADGIFANFSGITLLPFIYLVVAYIVTAIPIMRYDRERCDILNVTAEQDFLLSQFVLVIIVITILPSLEIIKEIPNALNDSTSLADKYLDRHEEVAAESIFSGIGGKLYRITQAFELVYPVLLFYFVARKEKKIYILSIVYIILTGWIYEWVNGSRTGITQNILYLIITYFIMRRFIPKREDKLIVKGGGTIIAVGFILIFLVTLSRFSYKGDNIDDMDILTSIALYIGEGPLNFNVDMWHVTRSTSGNGSFILVTYLLGLTDKITVSDNWDMVSSLGITGWVFYTYVGVFVGDFGKVGAMIVLLIMSTLTAFFTRAATKEISMIKIIWLCIWARILIVPTFYTHATFAAQVNLICIIGFCLILYSVKEYRFILGFCDNFRKRLGKKA